MTKLNHATPPENKYLNPNTTACSNGDYTTQVPLNYINQSRNDCLDNLLDYGLIVNNLVLDGQFHNVPTLEKPKTKKGWYVGNIKTINGRDYVTCTYGDFRHGTNIVYKSWNEQGSFVDVKALRAALKERQTIVANQLKEKQANAANTAVTQWAKLSEQGDSAYLTRKGVKAYSLRFGADYVAVPMMSIDGDLCGLQRIYNDDRPKMFGSGTKKKGAFHSIGEIGATIYFAEGYATAASIYEATQIATIVCFDAGNIEHVVKAFRMAYPALNLVICADNDQYKEAGNTGVNAAIKACRNYNARYVIPKFTDTTTKPTDFNDLHLLEGIDAVISQLQSVNPPTPTKKHLTATQASIELKRLSKDFFNGQNNSAIKVSAGTGKTRATIEAIANTTLDGQLHVFAPTHKLCDEWATNLTVAAPNLNIIHRYGREGNAEMDIQPLCQRNDLANKLISAGLPIYTNLCRNEKSGEQCPFFTECAYIKQQQNIKSVSVVIMPQTLLSLQHGTDEVKPDRVVIDETFFDILIGKSKSHEIKNILDYKFFQANKNHYRFIEAMIIAPELGFFEALRSVMETDSEGVLKELEAMRKEINEYLAKSRPYINPIMSDDLISKLLSKVDKLPRESQLINAIIKELSEFPGRNHSTLVNISQKKYSINSRSTQNRFNYFVNNSIPILAIDADANETILTKLMGADVGFHEINVKRNAIIKQCVSSTFAMSRFFKKNDDGTVTKHHDRINTVASEIIGIAGKQNTLLVTYKALEEEIKGNLSNNIKVLHFNALRGVDAYKYFEKVIVLGRLQPTAPAMENIASSLFWDDAQQINKTGSYSKQEVTFKANDGTTKHNDAYYHNDSRVNDILQQCRESEILQAIDRLRFIHGKSGREVFIMTNIALDVELDGFFNHQDFMPRKSDFLMDIFEELNGVLPTSPKFLYDNFGKEKGFNIQQVKDAFKRGISVGSNTLLQKCHLINYRLKSQKQGKHLGCYFDAEMSHNDLIKRLELFHGEPIRIIEPKAPEVEVVVVDPVPTPIRPLIQLTKTDGTSAVIPSFDSLDSGSRYFCESLFWASLGIPAQASGKNLTRPLMPSAPQTSCVRATSPLPS